MFTLNVKCYRTVHIILSQISTLTLYLNEF